MTIHARLFRLLIIVLIGIFVGLTSCKKALENLTTFSLSSEADFTISSTVGINTPFSVPTPDVRTNASQTFQNNNTRADMVKEARLESLRLTITSPSGQTFRFVKSVTLFVSADGLPEIEIASRTNIDNSIGASIDMETSSANLKEYAKKETFTLRSEVVTDETVLHDVDVRATMRFKVKAGVL